MAIVRRAGEAVTPPPSGPGGSAVTGISGRRLLQVLAMSSAILCVGGQGWAQDAISELPTEPILRIETGLHDGVIRGIDTDAANRFAVTVSYDKTARVWSLADRRLLKVLRLPIDYGEIGKAFAVAISPDGTTVAVGGNTGSEEHQNIFLFDRASGALQQRLGDLPDGVRHLVYSPDGRRLAATLPSGHGVRVFDAGNGYRPLPSDSSYHGHSNWATFDRSGRLVTASYEGLVRLYAADRYDLPIARFRRLGPYSAAFSPDGTQVAVGYDDTNDVGPRTGSARTAVRAWASRRHNCARRGARRVDARRGNPPAPGSVRDAAGWTAPARRIAP